jgi:glucosamine--fructose-6-phosphate aminotransferase (isomerizing)
MFCGGESSGHNDLGDVERAQGFKWIRPLRAHNADHYDGQESRDQSTRTMTTIFEEEMRSQAEILRLRESSGRDQARSAARAWRGVTHTVLGARGSSDNAALFFEYLAGRELGVLVALAAPSLYEGGNRIDLSGAGVLVISQSGRSPGIGEILQQAIDQGRPNAVITNDPTSPLAQKGQTVMHLGAGVERAVASTKTLTSSWHALAQFVEALKGGPLQGLDQLPHVVERVTEWSLSATLPVDTLNAERGLTVVGRGIGFAVSSEISLKLREVTGVRAESYAVSDFAHGPIGADGRDATLLLVVTEEMTDELCDLTLRGCRRAGMRTVVLRPVSRTGLECDEEIVLDEELPNWSLGVAQVVVGQALALRLGERRGRPIDTSPGLSKITLDV